MIIPTRVELYSEEGICTFLADVDYCTMPSNSDRIFLEHIDIVMKVSYVCHYLNQRAIMIVLEPVNFVDYDKLLSVLDWFKSNYEISDVKSDRNPAGYYVLYRSVIKILDLSRKINPTTDDIPVKKLAECCRAVFLSAHKECIGKSLEEDGKNLEVSDHIEELHKIIIYFKKRDGVHNAKLIAVIKAWDAYLSQFYIIDWDCDEKLAREFFETSLAKYPSLLGESD